jgi:DnaJ family protein B protein 12
VNYFVDPQTFPLHPTYRSFVTSNPTSLSFSPPSGATENSREYREALSAVFKGEEQKTAAAVEKAKTKGKQVEGLQYPKAWQQFERQVVKDWVQRLHRYCQGEINRREEALDRARGFLGASSSFLPRVPALY